MKLYDSLFMPYPYRGEKYALAQFTFGGGMENQTASFINSWDRQLIAHETAHQWFGDMVTCSTWGDMWLNEGFATYMEGLSYEYFDGKEAYRLWRKDRVESICDGTEYGSVHVPDSINYNRIYSGKFTYEKGGMVVHMLRNRLGDSAFFAGIRSYLQARKFQYAGTQNLQLALETSSRDTLSRFFQRWLYRTDYPIYVGDIADFWYISVRQNENYPDEIPTFAHFLGTNRDSIVYTKLLNDNTGNWYYNLALSGSPIGDTCLNLDYNILAPKGIAIFTNLKSQLHNSVICYPNPASNQLYIKGISVPMPYQMQSLQGQIIQSGTYEPNHSIPIQTLITGSYILKINNLHSIFIKK
jgi:aminopeptidase N